MRTQQEIESRMKDISEELENHKQWVINAKKAYDEDRKQWGRDADRGELSAAYEAVKDCEQALSNFNWVLNNQSL